MWGIFVDIAKLVTILLNKLDYVILIYMNTVVKWYFT